jgi:3-hydroxymyristoyl/3-hydroxydecanoyl-(acyl carrier protein) dehydratase
LFFFHYDCYVGDKKVLIMRNGCAGFFTDEELHDGKGVILTDSDKAQLTQAKKSVFTPLMQRHRDTYHYADMMKLVNGDLAGCFGQGYDQQGRNPSLKFSSAKFLMIERITKMNSTGGHWGLGLIEGQKDLAPEHWYFPCHFKDDQVMAGSLMSEGCGQMAMFYMLSLGMHKYVNNARFQPLPGESQTVRCRGQVLPQINTLTYRMEVTDIGMHPYPFLKANIDIILDGKVVVDFKNLSVMIKEQDKQSPYPVTLPDNVVLYDKDHDNSVPDSLSSDSGQTCNNKSSDNTFSDSQPEQSKSLAQDEQDERGLTPFKNTQRPLMKVVSDFSAPTNKGVIPIKHYPAPALAGQNRIPDKAPFSPWHLFEFATGNIANCFGADFDVYQGRIPPRTPCGDLQVVTQVVEVKGKRLDFNDPASCVAEYFVPEDAWYFTHNSHQAWMPYSLIMEIALQPNGFISGYMGTTLAYPDKDLFFRNLDGSGELVKQLDLRGKTIVNKSTLLSTTMAGGMIVQSFTFALYAIESGLSDKCNAHDDLAVEALFYQGTAVFGYFAEAALTNQLGIDNGKTTAPWFIENNTAKADIVSLDLRNKQLAMYQAPHDKPHYKLAGGKMNFIDTVSIVEGGGSAGVAYVYGERCIDASDWFFRYHFHQDPVMPGSLGVEAIIELLQTYALHNNLGAGFNNPRFIAPKTSVKWKYRGQITPLNKQMSLDIHITDIVKSADEVRLVGQANLSKDGLRIYQVSDLVLSIVEA